MTVTVINVTTAEERAVLVTLDEIAFLLAEDQ